MPTPLDAAYLTALSVGWPLLIRRRKRIRDFQDKLCGAVRAPLKQGLRAWFHGVSVGEIHLLRTVVARLRERRPDVDVVISSTTDTGLDEAHKWFADIPVVAWPLDFSWASRRALRAIQPDVLVLGESELWPGMLAAAHEFHVPVVVINGRISPKSTRLYRRIKPLAGLMLDRVSAFAMQSNKYAEQLVGLGVPSNRLFVTGSVKYDGIESNRENPATRALGRLFGIRSDQTVWIAGSTQDPEEEFCIRIFEQLRKKHESLRLIIVPRQKDRFDAVAQQLSQLQVSFVRRSQLNGVFAGPNDVILVDTIGELRAAWGLADIAFVGGSLDGKRGGQNMIEPAGYGAAVCFGPHTWNFQSTVDQLLNCEGAVQVPDVDGLSGVISKWQDPSARYQIASNGQAFVLSQQGATDRTIDIIERVLSGRKGIAAA